MDLPKDKIGPCSETCVMSAHESNEVTGINVERVTDMTEEEDQDPAKIPVIKTEPQVSCMSLVGVTHISYRLYPEFPLTMSVCSCNTKFSLLDNGFCAVFKKR
jgi:hypothetical protein